MYLGGDPLHGRKKIMSKKVLNHTKSIKNYVKGRYPGNTIVEPDVLGSVCEPPLTIGQKNYTPLMSPPELHAGNFSTTPSSFSSFSTTAIKKTPHCVSLKKSSLARRGYKSFVDWNSDPNHVYIGRNMSHHVAGALGSKWGNPFKAKKKNKNSLKRCLKRYEDHIRKNPNLFNAVVELEGKELGCWCKPSPCHGDVLIKLFKERQDTNL